VVAATVRLSWYGASPTEPSGITAEDNAGIVFNRENSKAGTSVTAGLPIPVIPSTIYSWRKIVALEVTAVGTTDLANRRISIASPWPAGLHLYMMPLATYADPALGTKPTDNLTTDAVVPSGYTEVVFPILTVYDATTIASTSLGRNGDFCAMVLGVDSAYAAGGGLAGSIPIPVYRLTYDEA